MVKKKAMENFCGQMEACISENGKIIKCTETVPINGLTGKCMLDNGKMVRNLDMVHASGQMVGTTLVSFSTTTSTEKESFPYRMVAGTTVTGGMACSMVKEHSTIH